VTQILIVDDEPKIRLMLQRYLEQEGFIIQSVASAKQAKVVLKQFSIDLILLDLRLGQEDGLDLLKAVREKYGNIGVIILSGKTELIDKIVGLELGADDYVTKPFHLRELYARIKTVLRRFEEVDENSVISLNARVKFGTWILDVSRQHLEDGQGKECRLTTGEFKLLSAFVSNPQRVLSRDQLLDLTSGRTRDPFDRTIDTQVRRLRAKLETEPNEPSLIKTMRGSGYIFTESVTTVI